MLQIVDLRQIDGVDQGKPGQRAGNHRPAQQYNQRGTGWRSCAGVGRGPAAQTAGTSGPGRAVPEAGGGDSQASQASWAFLEVRARKCFSLRLAF